MFNFFIKSLLIFVTLSISISASTSITKLKYEGGISIYGKIGMADIVLEEDLNKKTYKMKVKTYSTGIVKRLTSNRVDIFTSEGTINKGVYTPTKFTKHTTKNDYDKIMTYIFDYENNKVLKTTKIQEIKYKNEFDLSTLKIVKKQDLHKEEKDTEIELRDNDYLSMFLNVRNGNLKSGDLTYIDKKDSNKFFLIHADLADIQKKDAMYRIKTVSNKGIFFEELTSEDVSFYGDAYIKKISETTTVH